jgi:hypothetical protein
MIVHMVQSAHSTTIASSEDVKPLYKDTEIHEKHAPVHRAGGYLCYKEALETPEMLIKNTRFFFTRQMRVYFRDEMEYTSSCTYYCVAAKNASVTKPADSMPANFVE